MRFNKTLSYKLKRAIPMLGLAGATLFGSCSKDDNRYDVEYFFDEKMGFPDILTENNIDVLNNNPDIRYIYLTVTPNNDFTGFSSRSIGAMVSNMHGAFGKSDKLRGRGNIHFTPGVISRADSLYFLRLGYTVNNPALTRHVNMSPQQQQQTAIKQKYGNALNNLPKITNKTKTR